MKDKDVAVDGENEGRRSNASTSLYLLEKLSKRDEVNVNLEIIFGENQGSSHIAMEEKCMRKKKNTNNESVCYSASNFQAPTP